MEDMPSAPQTNAIKYIGGDGFYQVFTCEHQPVGWSQLIGKLISKDNYLKCYLNSLNPDNASSASVVGLEAIRILLRQAQHDGRLVFIVVLHPHPDDESIMAEPLWRATQMRLRWAIERDAINADCGHVIAPGAGVLFKSGVLPLRKFEAPRGLCHAIDSARYEAMPICALAKGVVDIVAPPEAHIPNLFQFFQQKTGLDLLESIACDIATHLPLICAHLKGAVLHDFFGHNPSTSIRRIERRMQVLNLTDAAGRKWDYYGAAIAVDVALAYRDRHFLVRQANAQIVSIIRHRMRFSRGDSLSDPAVSKLGLISWRNLSIYFGARVHSKTLASMGYASRPGGVLLLGPCDTIGRQEVQFGPVNQSARMFVQRDQKASPRQLPLSTESSQSRFHAATSRAESPAESSGGENIGQCRLLEHYCPAHMIVDAHENIVSSSGRLSRYLEDGYGSIPRQSISLVRLGLREPLVHLLRQVRTGDTAAVQHDIEVKSEFGSQIIDLVVEPLPNATQLVVFLDKRPFQTENFDLLMHVVQPRNRAQELEEELEQMRLRLERKIEELAMVHEQLKSSIVEMISINEELQSTNQVLTRVNDELTNKVEQLATVNDDVKNLLISTDLALVVVDSDLHIRTFTTPVCNVFSLTATDIGRSLADITNLTCDHDILADTLRVMREGTQMRRLVWSKCRYVYYQLRILPYRRQNGLVDGAMLTFADVTQMRAVQDNLRHEQERLQLALQAGEMGVWDYDYSRKVIHFDPMSAQLHGKNVQGDHSLETTLDKLSQQERESFHTALNDVHNKGSFQQIYRIHVGDRYRWIRSSARLISIPNCEDILLGVSADITAERQMQEMQTILIGEIDHRVKNLFMVVSSIIRTGARHATNLEGFVANVTARISALGRAHALTQPKSSLDTADMRSLIEAVLAPYQGLCTINLRGEDVALAHRYITPLGLIFHEWATNAAKYGSLSKAESKLDILWTTERIDKDCMRVEVEWIERSPILQSMADLILPPTGFGSKLIELSVNQIGGERRQKITENGFQSHLSFIMTGRS